VALDRPPVSKPRGPILPQADSCRALCGTWAGWLRMRGFDDTWEPVAQSAASISARNDLLTTLSWGRLFRTAFHISGHCRNGILRLPASPQFCNRLYVALYILGNYARYFPDLWMRDVEQSSPLALAVEKLLEVAAVRMPLAALSEMTRTCLVPAR
jgi:hypothetical protein